MVITYNKLKRENSKVVIRYRYTGFVRVLKTLEFQKSDCKALKVLEIDLVIESP